MNEFWRKHNHNKTETKLQRKIKSSETLRCNSDKNSGLSPTSPTILMFNYWQDTGQLTLNSHFISWDILEKYILYGNLCTLSHLPLYVFSYNIRSVWPPSGMEQRGTVCGGYIIYFSTKFFFPFMLLTLTQVCRVFQTLVGM